MERNEHLGYGKEVKRKKDVGCWRSERKNKYTQKKGQSDNTKAFLAVAIPVVPGILASMVGPLVIALAIRMESSAAEPAGTARTLHGTPLGLAYTSPSGHLLGRKAVKLAAATGVSKALRRLAK
jgi:hypothetical protein